VRDGRPYLVYCYEGNFEAIGEYFDFRRIGDEIVARFRWFDGDFRGFAWLKIDNPDRMTGAWWLDEPLCLYQKSQL
jgi:hypothetical protein